MTEEAASDPNFIDVDGLAFTLEEHERLKTLLHSKRFQSLAFSDRQYLVLGAGGDGEIAERRLAVYDQLDQRSGATAFRLEDFGLTPDEIALWAAAYEILCEWATHIVAVIEEYDGGYVWELGYLFHDEIREKVWILKREYGSTDANRSHYNNGMAASHLQLLENANRTVLWEDGAELEANVRNEIL